MLCERQCKLKKRYSKHTDIIVLNKESKYIQYVSTIQCGNSFSSIVIFPKKAVPDSQFLHVNLARTEFVVCEIKKI